MSRCDHKPRDDKPAAKPRPAKSSLSALEWQALKVAAKDAGKFRDGVKVKKDQPVDVTVRFSGRITVLADEESIVEKTPKLAAVLAVVLMTLRPAARLKVGEAVAKAFPDGPDTKFEPGPGAVELVQQLLYRVTRKEKQEAYGAVSGKIIAERVR